MNWDHRLRLTYGVFAILTVVAPSQGIAQARLTNQTLFDTVSFLPDHYDTMSRQFRDAPVSPGVVIWLGDSITEGGSWGQLTSDSTTLNRGISGDITYGVLHRLDEVIRHRPSKVFILIGVNDIAKDIPELVIADNCRKIVERLQRESPATRVYLQSVLPLDPSHAGFPQHFAKPAQVGALNSLLRRLAASTKVTYVDLWPAFTNSRGTMDERYTVDGLHLNTLGYVRWVARLKKVGAL